MTISRAPASASSELGGPGSQMSSQIVSPIRRTVERDQLADRPGIEVAALVEDAVVGQVHLAVAGDDPPVGDHDEAVVQGGVADRAADHRDDPLDLRASASTASSQAARKCGFSSRSSGG